MGNIRKRYKLSLLIVSSLFLLISGDPCSDYQTIDTWERSAANTAGIACDALLPEGWYRIISNAGELMPTECILFGGRCGTAFPIWLDGAFPNNGETVNVTACASDYNGNCCFKSYNIQIKDCSNFYVYNLGPVEGCPQSFCFGTELPCPEGQTSETGFTPGCKLDPCHSNNYVTITGEDKRSSAYIYQSGSSPIDDSTLNDGWYRFDSYVGNDLVNEQQSMMRCGTEYPVWMNGSLPTVADETVNRTCCLSGFSSTCESTVDIQIKNCGDFLVYNLVKLQKVSSAYCVGTLPVRDNKVPGKKTTKVSAAKWAVPVVVVLAVLCVIAGIFIYHRFFRKNSCSPRRNCETPPPPYSQYTVFEENKKNMMLEAVNPEFKTHPPMKHEIDN